MTAPLTDADRARLDAQLDAIPGAVLTPEQAANARAKVSNGVALGPLPIPADWTEADIARERARVKAALDGVLTRVFARVILRRVAEQADAQTAQAA